MNGSAPERTPGVDKVDTPLDGGHLITLSTNQDALIANRDLWHELGHAWQSERFPPDGWAFHAAYRASGGFRADIVAYRDSIYEIEARKIADTYGQFRLASGGGPMRLQPGYQWGDIGDAPALAPLGPQS